MCEHNVYHLVITCNKMKTKKTKSDRKIVDKGNNKIIELRTILQRESQNS